MTLLNGGSRGILSITQMLNVILSFSITAPLIVGTVLFVSNGNYLYATFTTALAVIAVFLPSYILRQFHIIDLIPSFLHRPLKWIKSLKP